MQKQYFYFIIIMLLLHACSTPTPSTSTPVDVTEPVSESTTQTQTPVKLSASETPEKNVVTHETIPSEGITDRATAHDNDNALSFDKRVVRSGDEFFRNRFERPFTANEMDYLPDLDIVNFSITSDDTFFYIR